MQDFEKGGSGYRVVGHDEGEGAGARSFYTMDDLECQIFNRNNNLSSPSFLDASVKTFYKHYWASEASPTLGCSIEISRDIYLCVCRGPKCARRITWPNTRMLKVSLGLYARAALAWTKKKRSLRNEKLKANGASVC